MNIRELQKNWNQFGKCDPLWAILTDPDKKGNKWVIDDFFRTGSEHVDKCMKYIESLDINLSRKKALDFGCGVGRLTQALGNHFAEVHGVDIAASMIELARKYNRYGDKCKYYVNESDDLRLFPDNNFDFILSLITLQHMEPQYAKNYLREFLRTLAPHGVLLFDLPSELIPNLLNKSLSARLKRVAKTVIPNILLDLYRKTDVLNQQLPKMEMYAIKQEEVIRFLENNKAKILGIKQIPQKEWIDIVYCVAKNE